MVERMFFGMHTNNQNYANHPHIIGAGDSAVMMQMTREDIEGLVKKYQAKSLSNLFNGKIDLRKCDLTGLDLRNLDLNIFCLEGAALRNAWLDQFGVRAILSDVRKGKISLREVRFEGINLEARWLDRSDIGLASYVRCDLSALDLEGANFSNSNLEYVDFDGAHLKNANFEHSILRSALMRECNLLGANLSYCDMKNANLKGSNLMNANMAFSDLTGIKL